MDTILLIDCSDDVTTSMAGLLKGNHQVVNVSFEDRDIPGKNKMIILQAHDDLDAISKKISKIRYECKFRDIPIVVVKQSEDQIPLEYYLSSGATEVLPLDAPPGACRQILQGYLIPSRKPLESETEYLTPFIENTINVLKATAQMDAVFREVYFSNDFRIFGDISGIIGLSGVSEGTVAVTLYWDLARKIIANMMHVADNQLNAEYIHDGVGELINVISGSTKKRFKGTPFHFDLSLPTVVVGSGHQLGHPDNSSIAVLIFDVAQMAFVLQVCLKPKQKQS
ncbi:MAG: chemotaxis protein CheX [Desulfatitalea sp.]|nr:chemotaxis protein CheX [Desulfatitalea sp.]NNK01514.1 chemotaxis protein CheX [Desulfatitalea sp.]